jgi:hypothetical protein
MVDDRKDAPDLANAGEPPPKTGSNAPDAAQAKALAEAESEAAKVSPYERRGTAAVAAAVFVLFVAAVYGFHRIAGVNSEDLGVSRWNDAAPIEARLKAITDTVLYTHGLAGWLARETDTSVLEAADADEPTKTWEAFKAIAEALTDDDARARLVARWTLAVRSEETTSAVRAAVSGYRRSVRKAEAGDAEQARIASGHVQSVVDRYAKGLASVADDWVRSELPQPAIEGLLKEQNAAFKKPAPPAPARPKKTQARTQAVTKAGGSPPPAASDADKDAATTFVVSLQTGARRFLTRPETDQQIRELSRRDLNVASAQEPLVKAIENDFSGRWSWTIAAAIFLTAAISAVLGGGWRVYGLAGAGKRMLPIFAYASAVVGGFALGRSGLGEMPAFLADTFDAFNRSYGLAIRETASAMHGVTAAAIGALIVAAWTSFLFKTDSDDYLEDQLALLRWSFHAATFVLVAGVLHTYAFYQWPSSFMGEAGSSAIQGGARIASLALGAVFSTLLLLIYVPGASVLKAEARARQPKDDPARTERIEEMLKRTGFDESPMQQIVRFAQLFAPLLIAPLGAEIVGLFGD